MGEWLGAAILRTGAPSGVEWAMKKRLPGKAAALMLCGVEG